MKIYILDREEIKMSEQNINTQFLNYIKENITGDAQQNALNFVQYLISIGMTAEGSTNDGKFVYKGKTVCYTYFGNSKHTPGYPEPYTIWTTDDDYSKEVESVPFNNRMKEAAWANAHKCDDNCPNKKTRCNGGQRKVIFGREFDNICVGSTIGFTGPDSEAVECAKKLMEMRKHAIDISE